MSVLSLPSTTDDVLLDELSAADLFRYGRTCKTIQAVVQSYLPRKFQLHKLLERYFTSEEIDHLRWLQAETGMLISGSTALQFFDRVVYPESDLDLYLEHCHREEMGLWLLEIGYEYVPHSKSSRKTFEDDLVRKPEALVQRGFIATGQAYVGGHCVFTFAKENPYRKVQLITSMTTPLERILNFHSTCVMNIITYDAAYAFFPKGTFEERRALACVDARPHNIVALVKYEKRGWSIGQNITRDEFDDPFFSFARGIRYVGDAQCWKLPIFPKIDARSRYNIESNSWIMRYDEHLNVKLRYSIVKSKRLLTTYLIEDHDEHLQRHLQAEINADFDSENENENEDPQYSLDDEFTNLIDWYRAGHFASESCQYSWPLIMR